jgi:hypothetical protein
MDEKQKELQNKYPDFLSNIYCGWSTGSGWNKLLEIAFRSIQSHLDDIKYRNEWVDNNPEQAKKFDTIKRELPELQVAQIKQKFGGLRLYIDNMDEYTNGIVAMTENMSWHICEDCGNPGKLREGGWYRTLCDTCHSPASREAKRQLRDKQFKEEFEKRAAQRQALKELSELGQELQPDDYK